MLKVLFHILFFLMGFTLTLGIMGWGPLLVAETF